jgi:hypothetical protein
MAARPFRLPGYDRIGEEARGARAFGDQATILKAAE